MKARRTEFVVLFLAALSLGLFFYQAVVRIALHPFVQLPSLLSSAQLLPLLLLLFSWFHAWYVLGLRHSFVLLAITIVVSWTFEQVGVATGWVYGAYHYTTLLGPKLGHVPLLIPTSWFMMGYPSLIISNLIVEGRATGRWVDRKHWLVVSLIGALVMTAWDLAMDPLMSSSPHEAWIWHHAGPYFGVPWHNFAGWIATTFTVHGAYRLYERSRPSLPLGIPSPSVASLPVWAYAIMMAATIVGGGPPGLAWVTAVVMGIPLLLGFRSIVKPRY